MSKQWAWQPITWTHTYTDSFGFVRLDCDADRITALVDGIDDRDFSFAHDEDVRLCRRVPASAGVPVDALNRVTAWVADWCNGNDDGFDDLAADVIESRAWLRSLAPAEQGVDSE